MSGFIIMSLVSILMIFITCLFTYEILGAVWNFLPRLKVARRLRVLVIVASIFLTHIMNIWLYAVAYFLTENFLAFGKLTGNIAVAEQTYPSFLERLYFSASAYASLGLGDIVPKDSLRMLASAEVLNGLVMIGWTVSFTYLTMEEFWTGEKKRQK